MDTRLNNKFLQEDLETLKRIMGANSDAIRLYELARMQVDDKNIQCYFEDLITLHSKTLRMLQVYSNDIAEKFHKSNIGDYLIESSDKLLNELENHLSFSNEFLFEHIEQVELRCSKTIEQAVSKDSLSPNTRHIIMREQMHQLRTQEYVNTFKNFLKAA